MRSETFAKFTHLHHFSHDCFTRDTRPPSSSPFVHHTEAQMNIPLMQIGVTDSESERTYAQSIAQKFCKLSKQRTVPVILVHNKSVCHTKTKGQDFVVTLKKDWR